MIFNEITYFLLFLIPCVIFFHLSSKSLKPWMLAAFGAGFFTYYGYLYFGGAWGAVVVLILLWELCTSRLYRPRSKWCLFGVFQAILILVLFKYLVFFTQVWNDFGRFAHLPPLGQVSRWVLPLGISFFTFEFIHFAVDTYVGKIESAPMSSYAAFIFFFPTMVSGPIKRYQEFSGQLKEKMYSPEMISLGVSRILVGLFKKHLLADTFALLSNHLTTDALYHASPSLIFLWFVAYGFRIYFDFSGYSDIAIGSGYLFGIRVPENFRWAFFTSLNIADYWRRWHMTLMQWIETYLYTPLVFGNFLSRFPGGVAGAPRLSCIAIVVFAIAGLWHGAAYNFICYGLFHGVLMSIHLCWRAYCVPRGLSIPAPLARLITYFSVTMSWGFFSLDLPRALFAYQKLLFLM